ncbi:GAF domain-containing protein [Chondrinema litorale]|uniref:GAF domain-containing protein n=1 Tax=Chondrinema litorale TaxID=2994555 RepID=UPI002543682A|nr:hypothetical protein [Chondrinema litorale]UZR96342.1 hypothetical protein OQ292_22035 [Chondrinema litorale]
MIYNGQEIEFPAIMQLSFVKLIENLENQAESSNDIEAAHAKNILQVVGKYPALKDGITNEEDFDKYNEGIQLLGKLLFPEVLSTNEIKILAPPFYFKPLITSKRFDSIIKASGKPFSFTFKNISKNEFYLFCCNFILGKYYGYPVNGSGSQMFEILNEQQGLIRTFKMLINADMCEFIPTDKAVDITDEDFEELINNFEDIELWKKKFPPNSWILRGINIVNLMDMTTEQAIGAITSNLIVKTHDSFEKIQWGIRKIFNNAALSIGVLLLEGDQLVTFKKEGMYSILLDKGNMLNCSTELCNYSYGKLIENKQPLIITNVDKFHNTMQSGLSNRLMASDIKSYMVIPLVHDDEFLGYIEIGSKNTYDLHQGSLKSLEKVLPMLAMAQKRFKTEAQNLIEAIIQQECTTIHPAVKWRFEEEAKQFMFKRYNGEQPVFKDIIFNNLYPLYAQMDIKGSSSRRNKAVSTDLCKQLGEVKKILSSISKQTDMTIFDELICRTDTYIKELHLELAAGSEHKILNFLKSDIYPVFEYFEKIDSKLKEQIEEYRSFLDPSLQTVYEERKKYDSSVNYINQRLASFIDNKQTEAQKAFPHYFERYKTDGIEYNIYIGQSITKNKEFDDIYLRNLRLWQLIVMCEMELEFKKIQKELDTTIEIASLVLVYNTPISVHFRMDEKKFDVEGAYNARYEIIKKRVDKAHIKDTNERITSPGKIVIVYSQEQDAKEYLTYLHYLSQKGYVKEEIEDLALEDLQGVHGLRALRAEVVYNNPITVDELITEMQRGNIN